MTVLPLGVADLLPGAKPAVTDGELRVPSPLDPAPSLGSELGVDLLVKREDRLDDLGCGHKTRKLAHVLAHARAQGATALVTAASVPSSQAVMVAASAAVMESLKAIAEQSLLRTRRPVLLAPTRLERSLTDSAMIAWDESPECWRAVSAAIPFLRLAKSVQVISVDRDAARRSSSAVATERCLPPVQPTARVT